MLIQVAPLADLLRQLRDSAAPRAPPSHDAHDAPVPRGVTAVARASAAVGLGGGEPFILRDAMDWLSGFQLREKAFVWASCLVGLGPG